MARLRAVRWRLARRPVRSASTQVRTNLAQLKARSAAVSTVTRHGPVCACRAERGALCTFRGHAHWFCLHIPRSCVRREPPQWGEAGRGLGEHGTGAVIFRGRGRFRVPPVITDRYSFLHIVRSAVGVILTSPSGSPRGGGEVRITETERSGRISAGRRRAGPCQRHISSARQRVQLCGRCMS